MPSRLTDFARQHGLELTPQAAGTLLSYATRVLEKKTQLNLTGADTLEEIVNRHLCDGLFGAAQIARLAQERELARFSVIDAGSGAGFIGLAIACALPQAQVFLVESLVKRCAFLNWIILKEKITNACVKNVRLGQTSALSPADFVTERAMGQLPDILGLCLSAVKPGGVFLAYQGQTPQPSQPEIYGAKLEAVLPYQLPQDKQAKHLVLCRKAL